MDASPHRVYYMRKYQKEESQLTRLSGLKPNTRRDARSPDARKARVRPPEVACGSTGPFT